MNWHGGSRRADVPACSGENNFGTPRLEPPENLAKACARGRVVVTVDTPTARWGGALAVLSTFCWLMVFVARNHRHPNWHPDGQLAWSLTILAAVALIARGIFLGRPVTAAHAGAAMVMVL